MRISHHCAAQNLENLALGMKPHFIQQQQQHTVWLFEGFRSANQGCTKPRIGQWGESYGSGGTGRCSWQSCLIHNREYYSWGDHCCLPWWMYLQMQQYGEEYLDLSEIIRMAHDHFLHQQDGDSHWDTQFMQRSEVFKSGNTRLVEQASTILGARLHCYIDCGMLV